MIKHPGAGKIFFRAIFFFVIIILTLTQDIFSQSKKSRRDLEANKTEIIDTILRKIDISLRLDSIEKKYGIKVYIGEFIIDTSRAEIAAIIADTIRRTGPNLMVPGLRKYSFNYLERKDEGKRDSLLQVFFEEWNKYPVEFVKSSQLTAIYFVKNLKVSGQSRYAMPEGFSNALYYDVNYVNGRSDQYLRHSMHHEFYHLIEKNYFGDYYFLDKSWVSFNPLDFTYGSGGAAAYANPEFARRQYPYKGFITGYATVGIEEDKAEVFGYLMTTQEFLKLTRWIKEDATLGRKVAYFMGLIRGMCRRMDYDFFLDIHQVRMKTISVPMIGNDIF